MEHPFRLVKIKLSFRYFENGNLALPDCTQMKHSGREGLALEESWWSWIRTAHEALTPEESEAGALW